MQTGLDKCSITPFRDSHVISGVHPFQAGFVDLEVVMVKYCDILESIQSIPFMCNLSCSSPTCYVHSKIETDQHVLLPVDGSIYLQGQPWIPALTERLQTLQSHLDYIWNINWVQNYFSLNKDEIWPVLNDSLCWNVNTVNLRLHLKNNTQLQKY